MKEKKPKISKAIKIGLPIALFAIVAMILFLPKENNQETKAGINVSQGPTQIAEATLEESSEPIISSEETAQSETEPKTEQSSEPQTEEPPSGGQLEVHFVDVGQGDATLLKCDGQAMLIDTGDTNKGTAIQNYLNKQGVTKLDYLILTHPDADHIGGAPVIITKFEIDKVFVSNFEKDNKTYQKLIQALDDKLLKYTTPEVGETFTLGQAQITILAPNKKYDDPNNSSIALTVTNGGNTFLFTGDAEEDAEADILSNGLSVKADVYQVGHHGSRTSTSEQFLQAVQPSYAVISCEEGNEYGHPHAQTLISLGGARVRVFRTDEQGSIVATSDGKEITWNCAPSETWKAGEPTQNSSSAPAPSEEKKNDKAAEDKKPDQEAKEPSPNNETPESVPQSTAPPAPPEEKAEEAAPSASGSYIGNINNGKLHRSSCSFLPDEKNQVKFEKKEDAVAAGYSDPCKKCNP